MLGKHVELLSGYAFKSKEFNDTGLGVPVVRIRDVGKEKSETFYDGEYSDDYLLDNGDLLIGMDGDFRLAEWKGGKALLNQRVCKITPKDSSLDRVYMYYMLPRELKRIEDTTSFATVKHLSVKKINNIEIPLPPLDQQKKIAAILDAADAYRQKTKALITKYNELTQSLFLDMFGDLLESNNSLITLEELCGKGKYGSGASAIEFTEGSPRYIRITDINQDGSLNDKVVSPDELDIQYLLGKNDIVFARSGATVGKTYLYDEKDGDLVYAGYLIKFKIPEPYNAKYFFHFTKTEKYKAWVKNQQNVVAQPNINAKQYGNELKIPVPPLDLQNQFAERVQAIEAQKAQVHTSLVQAEDLFNSLLQRAFKGELI